MATATNSVSTKVRGMAFYRRRHIDGQSTNKQLRPMVFGSVISSPRGSLSLQQALNLANIYLENARKTPDPKLALVLCHDTEVSLSHVKKVAKHVEDNTMREGIASAYIGLGELLHEQGHQDEAQAFYKKSEKWGGRVHKSGRPTLHSRPESIVPSTKKALHSTADTTIDTPSQSSSQLSRNTRQPVGSATISRSIFSTNVRPHAIAFIPPEPDSRLTDTIQLGCCLGLLQSSYEPDDILDTAVRNWLLATRNEPDERDRLNSLATNVIRAFKRDEFCSIYAT
ncbi:MAG: hypothetical protein J3Q66DRAFT_387281 [Benniella sp.]|nr:MAG: hypothetical protein J3Q66DRAFT_387281 [Benniella sp.]